MCCVFFSFLKIFDVDHFLKALLNLLQYCFCGLCSNFFFFFFFFFLATRNLSSLTKDQTHTSALKGKVLTTGPPTKSLHSWWSSLMIILYYVSWCCYCCSVATSCLTLHNPMDCSRPGFWCYCTKTGLLVSTGQSFSRTAEVYEII